MDNLGWDDPLSHSSCLWSNHQQHEIGQSCMVSNSSGYDILGCKIDLPQIFFGPIPVDSINAAPTATWGEALTQHPTLSGVNTDFGDVDGLQVLNGIEDCKKGSLESLDCLFSATNSINTDTSVEYDRISMILSDCRNLWNFSSSSPISSGESENNREILKQSNETISVSDLEISQGFSRPLDCTTTGRTTSTNKGSKDGHLQSDSSTKESRFQLIISKNPPPLRSKRPRLENRHQISSNINFQQPSSSCISSSIDEPDTEAIAHMKEMIYRAAALRPVNLGMEVVKKPKRKNIRISSDPQTVAARHRRERISERIKVLQRLVPGGSKTDTATMLDEAANYLKFLRSQVKALENMGHKLDSVNSTSTNLPFLSPSFTFRYPFPMQTFFPFPKP
ncbi:hypothetical protein NE237_025712 [Protea cynaroides]|uniref:BHLH domain-containing protein n=1 Tax=Protea cynaroides TaxID=273540 RepID=A0A9Q0H4R3_9MAGN|nr:hypothetical protein NE237_025712 [Protea cynaroides]